MNEPVLVIVGDDRRFAAQAADLARSRGFATHVAHSVAESEQFAAMPRDLSLLDVDLPDGSGFDVLDRFEPHDCEKVVLITGQPARRAGEIGSAARAAPVSDYLTKPLSMEKLDRLLGEVSLRVSRRSAAASEENLGLLGESRAIRRLRSEIRKIAPCDVPLLLTGETGTGKELVARALHRASGRHGPLVAVNCGAVAPELLASQLFGHERGSFTGANARHIGVFEQAQHGTLFLDEIAEMAPQLQVYLLRVLESGAVTRVGGNSEIAVAARVVAATNRYPQSAIADGLLREDLYYRLAGYEIAVPPLRDRDDDVLLLANAFLDEFNAANGTRRTLDPRLRTRPARARLAGQRARTAQRNRPRVFRLRWRAGLGLLAVMRAAEPGHIPTGRFAVGVPRRHELRRNGNADAAQDAGALRRGQTRHGGGAGRQHPHHPQPAGAG